MRRRCVALQLAVLGSWLVSSALPAASPQVDEFFGFLVTSGFATPPTGVLVCQFGFGEHTAELSRRILAELQPPTHRAHVAFFRYPSSAQEAVDEIVQEYPERAHAREMEPFESLCSVLVLAPEDPRFTAEEIQLIARSTGAVVGHLHAGCLGERGYTCRFFQDAWESLVGSAASCGKHFCAAMLPAESLEILSDPLLAGVDCASLRGPETPLSSVSQWQQDWFVYRNFIRGTSLDTSAEEAKGAARRGVFVDVGAFHPIHLSNTFFFERCLGWQGLCAEPNPNWVPYFNAYRPNCQLVRNCVWSKRRQVTMSFEKDPIEAYIQEEGESGAVLIAGNGTHPTFTAECRTLEDILSSAGLEKPARIDYLSVDAEAAEVEIFKEFPFHRFDISVISVEVQARNYYDLDVVFAMADYAKLAVLGGDHVYAKLAHGLKLPDGAADWHKVLSQDFHHHVVPRTATLS